MAIRAKKEKKILTIFLEKAFIITLILCTKEQMY